MRWLYLLSWNWWPRFLSGNAFTNLRMNLGWDEIEGKVKVTLEKTDVKRSMDTSQFETEKMGEFRKWMSHSQNVRNWFLNYAVGGIIKTHVFGLANGDESCCMTHAPCRRHDRVHVRVMALSGQLLLDRSSFPQSWVIEKHCKICEWYLYRFHDRNWSSFTMFIRRWKTNRSTNLYWSWFQT